jgi:regulator of protease activity HflC (stomatin/prohibitin superfamily)
MKDNEMQNPVKLIAGAIGALVVLFIVLTVFFGSWYTVDQTQRAVLLRNGAFVEVVQPGLHFKLPWVETVYKIDMQTHTKTYGRDEATNKDVMEAYSADQQPAYLRVSVTLHVKPDKVAEMYSRFGGDYEAAIGRTISPHVYERVKVVFGQYTAAKAISSRGQLNSDAAKSIADAISYDPVFVIESAQIENISFSQDYIKSVEQRMQAEVEVQKYQQQLQRERIQADIAVTQAEGRAKSVRAEAQANADATVLRGNAEATAIKAKADALSSNSNLIALTTAEKWNGALPATMVPGSSVPFLGVK